MRFRRFVMIGAVCLLASRVWAQSDTPTPAAPDAPSAQAPSDAATPVVVDAPASTPPIAATPAEPVVAPDRVAAPTSPEVEVESALSPEPDAPPSPDLSSMFLSKIQIHGFVSEGGFVSTANDYIGSSSDGSFKFLDAGINFTLELVDHMRVGLQIVSRSVGTLSEETPRLDWAVIDYRFVRWLGLRAGLIKMPLGLYNEYVDIDSARTAILMPQSLYPIRNRDALISHIGFSAYGNLSLNGAGELEYQAWLGTLSIPRSALELAGATLNSVNTKYVTGGQVFWRLPLDGLRVGATYMRASIDFNLTLDANSVTQLVMAGVVPDDYRGALLVSQRPTSFWVASAEYIWGDFRLAAEYGRGLKHQVTSLPQVIPAADDDAHRFYGMTTYRLSPLLEVGAYYSMVQVDPEDRPTVEANSSQRFQRDLAATLRLDVNDYWLWKVEAHFIDGTADLQTSLNPDPERYWGLFLFRTTVTFK